MDIAQLGISSVAAITVVAYLVGQVVKATGIDNKYIPCICGMAGALLGLVWFAMRWSGFPAEDPITAAAVGIVSGLAATGINQVVKQLAPSEEE